MKHLKRLYDIAFNNIASKEHCFSIKDSFGFSMFINNNNQLCIDIRPTRNKEGWLINFTFLKSEVQLFSFKKKPIYAKKSSKDKFHSGYLNEWTKYRQTLIDLIFSSNEYSTAIQNGLYVVGRSKGGGMTTLIALDLVRNFNLDKNKVFVAQIEAPKVCNKHFVNSVYKYLNKENIFFICYKQDIVPKLLPYNKYSGNKIKLGRSKLPFSFRHHKIGCFDEEEVYKLLIDYIENN